MKYLFACANCGEIEKEMNYSDLAKFNHKCECGWKLKRTYVAPALNDASTGGDVNAFRERLIEGVDEKELDSFLATDKGERMAEAYFNLKTAEGKLVKERSNDVFDDIEADGRWARTYAVDDVTGKTYNPKDDGRA